MGLTPLVVIVGATAVGKTGLAIELARRLNGEIISADSRQVYRYMDIGTAKPTPEQRAAAPHHLIDIVNPDQELSLAVYQRQAYCAIDDMIARGKLPFLVGGTGQYITAVIEGWTIPAVPPNLELRAELEAYAAQHGELALFDRLHALDPAAKTYIDPRNVRRVVRALEVTLTTGQPFSAQRQKQPPPYRILQYGLTLDRVRLHQRADERLEQMIRAGFVDEVRALLEAGYDRHLPAMSALGYPQIAAHLLDGTPLSDALEQTRAATRAYIRRQLTWFKGHDDGMLWVDAAALDPDALAQAVAAWIDQSETET